MSAFMISNDCMNNIINGLFWNHKFKDYYPYLFEQQNLKESKDFENLAKKLFTLNQAALIQRYPNEKPTSSYIKIPKFKWINKSINSFQCLKSLHCLRYQCSEGDIPEEPLYKWLNDIIEALSNHMIDNMPEYEKAKWDN